MRYAMNLLNIVLLICCGLLPWYSGAAVAASYKECIKEPIFKGSVCTMQANRAAKVGVILIHGLGGSTDDWVKTIPALSANFHVVAFDLPGFGQSDKGSQDYSPTRYAHLVQYLADRYLQNKPYHVAGHSMGGAIALRYAAQRPSGLQRLVLIDAAGILHPQVITKYQAGSMMERASGVQQTRGFIERLSGKLLEQAERLPISAIDIANNALGRDLVLQGGPHQIAALALAGEDFGAAIATVTAPTLILWGDHDLIAPLRTGKVLATNMMHARMEVIYGAGHEPMLEQAERLNALLYSYLSASNAVVTDYFNTSPIALAFASERKGRCSGESGKVFEGDYRSIELLDCSNISIRNARVGRLKAVNSRLSLSDTDILGGEVGLLAENSDITLTNGEISGGIAIKAAGSRIDAAGVRLRGTHAAVRGVNSKLVFSVSQVNSPQSSGHLHAYKNMVDEEF